MFFLQSFTVDATSTSFEKRMWLVYNIHMVLDEESKIMGLGKLFLI